MSDPKAFELISSGRTEGIFQIESNMMKGLVKNIQPDNIEDLAALVAIGRPGPLSVGADKNYALWKKDPSKKEIYLRGIDNILARSFGTIIYQESLMLISMQVCGFNQGQSDSIMRKIIGKKQADKLEMLRRMMIYGMRVEKGPESWENNPDLPWYDEKGKFGDPICGAVANGYTPEEIDKFFKSIQSFASYAFNLGHSLSYGLLSLYTAYLKAHYPSKFMSAVLTSQETDEKKEKYINVCRDMGISILPPDINESGENFTATDDNTIRYGLGSIKRVKQLTELMENRPYNSVEDAFNRLSSKQFSKTVAENLIKSGSFDFEDTNRNTLLNQLYRLRNKKEDLVDENLYSREVCMEYEQATLGTSITYKSVFKQMMAGESFNSTCTITDIREHTVKSSGSKMGFIVIEYDNDTIKGIIFSKLWKSIKDSIPEYTDNTKSTKVRYYISGKMDDKKEAIIISKIKREIVNDSPIVFDSLDFSPI